MNNNTSNLECERMSDTPETDAQLTTFESISKLKKRFVNRTGTVSAEFARELERERGQWRKCAEKLAKALRGEWKLRALIRYVDAHEALAEFEQLKEETNEISN